MWWDDPFKLFRTLLFVALSTYFLLTASGTIWRIVTLMRGEERHKQLLRTYVSYQLVTFRVRPLGGELLQIVLWLGMLLFLWWMHTIL